MQASFLTYGDILLVNATYRTNKYKLPLVIFSGFTYKGRNCIFDIGIVNDEKETTYNWLFGQFRLIHKVLPQIVGSDHDLAIASLMANAYKGIICLLCLWHIEQNLKKQLMI